MAIDALALFRSTRNIVDDDREPGAAPLAGTRRERIQRLQIGLFGLGFMVLSVGLANIIQTSAQQNQAAAVDEPPASPTKDVPPPPRDPLADVGVAPDLAEPDAVAGAAPLPQAQEGTEIAPLPRD